MLRIFGALCCLAFITGCTTTSSMEKPVALVRGPAVKTVSGPYDAAKACIARVPEVKSLKITVGNISDQTGQVNVAEGGTGTFITQGASDMFNSTLAEIGVQLVELSPEYRQTVDWLASKNVKGGIKQAQFVLLGSVTALSFVQSGIIEASVYGAGPKARSYQALGRMDVRLMTLPFGRTVGGANAASASVDKQFAAKENEFGVGTFLGGGSGLTYASFRIGESNREPMQHAIGFMVDYAAVTLIANLLEDLSAEGKIKDRRPQIAGCRELLDDPYGRRPEIQVASAT